MVDSIQVCVLEKLVKSFHDDMQAAISVGDNVAQVAVSEASLAPTLFITW